MPSKKTAAVFTFALQNAALDATSSRKSHILRLNDVLHLSIERGDWDRACRAWSILARCKEYDWKRDWKTALLLLKSNSTTSLGRNLGFLRKMMRRHPEEAESILREIILCMAEAGDFSGALDELDLYLPAFPYQNNAELHTYAGLMSLYSSQLSTDSENQATYEREMLKKAIEYFDKSLLIDPDNIVAKTFKEEASARQLQANMSATQLGGNVPSDEEMDTDADGVDGRARKKRARGLDLPDTPK